MDLIKCQWCDKKIIHIESIFSLGAFICVECQKSKTDKAVSEGIIQYFHCIDCDQKIAYSDTYVEGIMMCISCRKIQHMRELGGGSCLLTQADMEHIEKNDAIEKAYKLLPDPYVKNNGKKARNMRKPCKTCNRIMLTNETTGSHCWYYNQCNYCHTLGKTNSCYKRNDFKYSIQSKK